MDTMMIVHDSQSAVYRWPLGAVAVDTQIRITVAIRRGVDVKMALFRIWRESGSQCVNMAPSGGDGTYEFFTATVKSPPVGELLWYYFMIERDGATIYYGNNAEQLGGLGCVYDHEPPSFQITVYDRNSVPDWAKHGIMYQIFPDRFAGNGEVLAEKKGALLHASWENTPYYIRNAAGGIVAYDFFGGNLLGIINKLDYLQSLSVTALYLNPIFEAVSNHRYDTADYRRVDPLLGTNEQFAQLCAAAAARGIHVILDGVFSHTGSDSVYFNKYGRYPSVGAYQSTDSPYYRWYDFKRHPDEYESWWGFGNLPNVKEMEPSYLAYIIEADDSVLKYWLSQGVSGWRLDVVDELPDEFVRRFYRVLKQNCPESLLIGEVWEDVSNKVSYSQQRNYLCGGRLDSAMNYPLREIMIDFVMNAADGALTQRRVLHLQENYPPENFYAMMNILGSHDVARILTVLGGISNDGYDDEQKRARARLSDAQYAVAERRLKLLAVWQMTFPGLPCIYYGDEAGMQGLTDPYNRGPYPWGRENEPLLSWFRELTRLRSKHAALRTGRLYPLAAQGDVYGYIRQVADGRDIFDKPAEDATFIVLFNRSLTEPHTVTLELNGIARGRFRDIFGDAGELVVRYGVATATLAPCTAVVYGQLDETRLPRCAGVLLHPTSLPSKYGCGDIGKGAYEFVQFLERGGQKLWQILPLNPVGYGYSPYQSPSAFAGNPLLISIDKLMGDGLLTIHDAHPLPQLKKGRVDYVKAQAFKTKLLRVAYRRFSKTAATAEYGAFCSDNSFWLDDYCLFMALKKKFHNSDWADWERPLARREPAALLKYRRLLADEIGYYKFVQYKFFEQWRQLKHYANERGVKIIGDMPIFIAYESADVWAHQELFLLDGQGRASQVAGVPPDYFSKTGQLWGNPHYDWEKMRQDDYLWWRERFQAARQTADYLRLDHFRAFQAFWQIPAGASTAQDGCWVSGPQADFFTVVEQHCGPLPLIAEDLGVITDDVRDLKAEFAFPGMKVLQFEIAPDETGRSRFHCESNAVVYTGTHDNNTTVGWLQDDVDEKSLEAIGELLGVDGIDVVEANWELIKFAYAARGAFAIIPMQDLLGLDGDARMNIPGTVGGNWSWAASKTAFSNELALKLRELCARYHR